MVSLVDEVTPYAVIAEMAPLTGIGVPLGFKTRQVWLVD